MSSEQEPKDGGKDAPKTGGRSGKKAKAGDRAGKGEKGDVLAEVRRLAADLANLRGEMAAIRTGEAEAGKPLLRGSAPGTTSEGAMTAAAGRAAAELAEHLRAVAAATGMPAVALGCAFPPAPPEPGEEGAGETGAAMAEEGEAAADVALLSGPEVLGKPVEEREARAARLGFALSSPQKVALARLLLENGARSAAQLGEGAGLTTGSLYHHLREMQHAGVVGPAGRSRYLLTELGRRATLTLLALAERHRPAG